ncbi:MAG: hypothetical protein Q7R60_03975 [bacterium]|nr:hypothetical protein [bacterium]
MSEVVDCSYKIPGAEAELEGTRLSLIEGGYEVVSGTVAQDPLEPKHVEIIVRPPLKPEIQHNLGAVAIPLKPKFH